MKAERIDISELSSYIDPVVKIRDEWFIVAAESEGQVAALTAGWGALGNVWEKKTITVYIRPQRYTKEFMDKRGRFTATFFNGHQKELLYIGSHSGHDLPDKISRSGLNLEWINGEPTFREGRLVLSCRILYRAELKEEAFIDKEAMEAAYPDKDYSVMYIAEIENAYRIEA